MRTKRALAWAILFGLVSLMPARAADLNPQAPFVRLAEGSTRKASAMDAGGRLHVAWLGAPTAEATPLRFTTVTAGQPGPSSMVTNLVGMHNERRPLALAIAGESLYLAYNPDRQRVCVQQRAVGGGSWSNPECVSSPSSLPNGADVDVAVLADGTVALAWQHAGLGVALRRTNGAWQTLPDPGADEARERMQPRLVATGNDLTVLWVQRRADGLGNSVRTELLGRTYAGGNWSAPVSVSGFDANQGQWQAQDPAIVADKEGTLHLAYLLFAPGEDGSGPRNRIMYRRGALARLSPPEGIAREAAAPALAVRDGAVDLAWYTAVGPIVGVMRVQNQEIQWSRRTTAWSDPRSISGTAGPSQEPALHFAPDGRSVIVWQDWFDGPAVLVKQSTAAGTWAEATAVDLDALRSYTERADRPIDAGATARSWLWGPNRWAAERETYSDAAEASRPVFYYDKARIEVTDPNRAPGDPAYFTNGLLVTEMASGRMQYGDQIFVGRAPAAVPVAGDSTSTVGPTYASFRSLVYIPEIGQLHRASDRTRQTIKECLSRAGAVMTCSPSTQTAYGHFVAETGHNIAMPFWTFLNQTGPIYEGGRLQNGLVFPWVKAMGYPIAEPYWTRAVVRGAERDVLVQLFQRRVLSYTPGNPAGFEVEMGNVGQHYYTWRYSTTPWVK